MPPTYLTFQKFNDPVLAAVIAEKLKANGIDNQVVNEGPILDATIMGNDLGQTIHLKILPEDFTRAHAILEDHYQAQLQNIDADYYLFSFSNAELLEIVQRPDEWGHLDYALAKRLLAERGQEITAVKEEQFRQERLTELARPEQAHGFQIVLGYIGAIVVLLGGITGAMFGLWGAFGAMTFGYMLGYLKKTLPNGERVYIYSQRERRHGKRIMVLAAIAIPLWFLSLLFLEKR